jgi:hypothetical protein
MTAVSADAAATIPADWADVTPEWMTGALQRRLPGVEVATVEVVGRDDGTNRRGRLGLRYARGTGPEVVFVKAEGAHREVHARNGNLFNEPELFAADLALPVDHPFVYHVVIDRPALDYVIVMEDVTRRGGEPRDATQPFTVEQAERGVRGLATLHSRYWGEDALAIPALAWLEPFRATPGWQQPLLGLARSALDTLAGRLPDEVVARTAEELLDQAVRSMDSFGLGTQVLLHADPHIGNTYLLPDGDVGFLDWQVCHRGSWAHDLAYFVVSALTVDDRRGAEQRLLRAYYDTLDVPAGQRPTFEEVQRRYDAAHAYGLVVWLATHGNHPRAQTPEVCRALIDRYAAAYVDSRTEQALELLAG